MPSLAGPAGLAIPRSKAPLPRQAAVRSPRRSEWLPEKVRAFVAAQALEDRLATGG